MLEAVAQQLGTEIAFDRNLLGGLGLLPIDRYPFYPPSAAGAIEW